MRRIPAPLHTPVIALSTSAFVKKRESQLSPRRTSVVRLMVEVQERPSSITSLARNLD